MLTYDTANLEFVSFVKKSRGPWDASGAAEIGWQASDFFFSPVCIPGVWKKVFLFMLNDNNIGLWLLGFKGLGNPVFQLRYIVFEKNSHFEEKLTEKLQEFGAKSVVSADVNV